MRTPGDAQRVGRSNGRNPTCAASKSCLLGFLICLALLALLFGIDAISRDIKNERHFKETEGYVNNATCRIHSVALRRGRSQEGSECTYASYILTFTPETVAYYANSNVTGSGTVESFYAPGGHLFPGATAEDFGSLRQSYSNFFDRACGGVFPALQRSKYNVSDPTSGYSFTDCWFRTPTEMTLRISPMYERDLTYRIYGITLLVAGGGPLVVFVFYNCFLCCYACFIYSGQEEAEHRNRLERQRLDRARQEELRNGLGGGGTSGNAPIRTEVYEIPDIDDLERQDTINNESFAAEGGEDGVAAAPTTWKDRFTGNSYARAVMTRLDRIRVWRRKRQEIKNQQREAARLKALHGAGEPVVEMTEGEVRVPVAGNSSIPPTPGGGTRYLGMPVPASLGPTPRGELGDELPAIEECQVCLEAVMEAVVVYPCGHYFCDDCVIRLLDRNYQGFSITVKCPVCRLEHPDDQLIRVRMCDNSRSPGVMTGRVTSAMPSPSMHEAEAEREDEATESAAGNPNDPFETSSHPRHVRGASEISRSSSQGGPAVVGPSEAGQLRVAGRGLPTTQLLADAATTTSDSQRTSTDSPGGGDEVEIDVTTPNQDEQ